MRFFLRISRYFMLAYHFIRCIFMTEEELRRERERLKKQVEELKGKLED